MNTAALNVSIQADVKSLSRGIEQAKEAVAGLQRNVGSASRSIDSGMDRIAASASAAARSLGAVRMNAETLDRVGTRMADIGRTMTVGLTLPLVAAGAAAVRVASDAAEAASKMDAVFGGAVASMNAELAAMRNTIPATTAQLQGMASGIQDLLVPLGMAAPAAQQMTTQVVKLAGDLASFNNIGIDQSLEKIRAALVGSYEPALAFGVALNAANVKTEAIRLGLIKYGDELDANARAQAAFSLLLQGTTAAHGDAARTADSAANSFKFLQSNIAELAGTIGGTLLPVITPMVRQLTEAVKQANQLSPTATRAAVGVGALAASVGLLGVALGTMTRLLPTAIAGLGSLLAFFSNPIVLGLAAVGAMGAAFMKLGDEINKARKGIAGLGTTAQTAQAAVAGMAAPVPGMLEGITVTASMTDKVATGAANAARQIKQAADATREWYEQQKRLLALNDTPGARLSRATPAGGGGEVPQIIAKFAAVLAPAVPALTAAQQAAVQLRYAMEIAGQSIQDAALGAVAGINQFAADAVATGRKIYDAGLGMGEAVRGGLAMAGVMAVIGGALETLTPILNTLMIPLRLLGQIIAKVVLPPLQAMAYAIGFLIRSLGKAIDAIPGVSAKSMIRAGQEMMDQSGLGRGLVEAGAAANAAAEGMNRLAGSLTNVPSILKLAQIGGAVATPYTPPTIAFPRGPQIGSRSGPVTVTQTFEFNVQAAPGEDGATLLTKLRREIQQKAGANGQMTRNLLAALPV